MNEVSSSHSHKLDSSPTSLAWSHCPSYLLGGTVAAIAVFLPCYLLVIIPARYFRRSVHDPRAKAFVDGVTAAAAGAIAGAAFVLGRRAIFDIPTAIIGLAALAALTRMKGVSEPVLILAAGVVGIVVTAMG
jgi:chromate transporter